jgi:hypothetical protein
VQHNNPFHLTPSLTPFDGFRNGMKRSPTSGWERTPWHATQRAAWAVLKKADT